MSAPDLPAILDELHATIRHDIAGGFEAPRAIVDAVVELFSDQIEPAILRPHAERMIREILRQRGT